MKTPYLKRKILALSVAAAFTMTSPAVKAADAVVVVNFLQITQPIVLAINSVTGAVTSAATSIVQAILQASTQGQADAERQNVINRTIAEAAQNYDKQYRLQEHAVAIEQKYGSADPNSATQASACEQIAVGENLANAVQEKRVRVGEIANNHVAMNTATEDPMVIARQTLKIHSDNFCSDEDKNRGRCATVASAEMQNADLKASTFFTPNDTMTYGEKEQIAARQFMDSLVGSNPTVALNRKEEKTPAGRAYLAEQYAQQRKIDVAAQSLREIYASREDEPGLGTKVNMPNANVSVLGVIKYNASKFLDPEWHTRNGSNGDTELLREQTRIAAFKTWMDYKSYEKLERIESLMAIQTIDQVKVASSGNLKSLRARALQMNGTR